MNQRELKNKLNIQGYKKWKQKKKHILMKQLD